MIQNKKKALLVGGLLYGLPLLQRPGVLNPNTKNPPLQPESGSAYEHAGIEEQ
jgi:hypothetical protein